MSQRLVLASTSQYKRAQLRLLGVPFTCVDPGVHEDHAQYSGDPESYAIDLSQQKAIASAKRNPTAWVLGSDQVAVAADGTLLTKAGTPEKAVAQLLQCQNQTATFYSAACLLRGDVSYRWSVRTRVTFRQLDYAEICRYVEADRPEHCAGSFKVEALGISLFRQIQSNDPSALVGLPLMTLAEHLRQAGFQVP
ncbi:MAG: Maf family protein [Reinekea forsetii]|nr:Maf family protein [Reinekea forsetii]MDO7645982.1 Maf family protein [Reinekea forsetii]